jgi:glycosyltransferase involved in cell wall biosynthesis
MPLVSVVVPVYNCESFLDRCIKSIISQSFKDIEIILVDDGSTDDSLSICKWYAKKYPCVSVIKQKNQRVAVARNSGILVAKGEYL